MGHMNSHNQMNLCLCVNSYNQINSRHHANSYNQMNSCHYIRIHTSYEFMLCWNNSLLVVALIFLHFWHSEGGRTVFFVSELVLMRLEVCKEDLFALLLSCWQLHCLIEVAVVEVAE
jgi:hypothetical protein